jgi:hypothetical protein
MSVPSPSALSSRKLAPSEDGVRCRELEGESRDAAVVFREPPVAEVDDWGGPGAGAVAAVPDPVVLGRGAWKYCRGCGVRGVSV